jgi:hypothetical protein
MNSLIIEILKKGFTLEMEYNPEQDRIEYYLFGFYKSDRIMLYENDHSTLTARSRYDEIDIIDNFYNLVALNYRWWISSRERYDGWKVPDSKWLPFLIEEGFVVEKVDVVKSYDTKKY